jgi:hypothetical protein
MHKAQVGIIMQSRIFTPNFVQAGDDGFNVARRIPIADLKVVLSEL